MALVGMPRGNATAWVSKPRHRSPPIRPGDNNPGPDHGFKILRSGNLSRARHTSPPGKGGDAGPKNDLQPVAATTRTRLHLPSRKPTNQEVQISPAKSKLPIWQVSSRPNPIFRKNQKNTLFRSDTTDPGETPATEPGETPATSEKKIHGPTTSRFVNCSRSMTVANFPIDTTPSLTDIQSRVPHLQGNLVLHPASWRTPAR